MTLYRDLLRRFAEGYGQAAESIHAALKRGDGKEADRVAHTLKGVAGNIGAREVSELAGRMRQVVERGDEKETEALLRRLEEVLGQLVGALAGAIVGSAGPAANGAASADVPKLRRLIASSDADAIDWFNAHRSALERLWGREPVSALGNALDAFDFPRAAAIIGGFRDDG